MSVTHTPEKATAVPKMDEFKLLIHQRGQIQAKVTVIAQALEKAEEDLNQVSLPLLKVYSKKLDVHYKEYNEIHKEILSKIPSTKLDEQDEKLENFDNIHTDAMVRLEYLSEALSKPSQTSVVSDSSRVIIQQQPLKAPIPVFDGLYENWPRFKSMFQDIIGRCSDSDAVKLHHLDKALVGAAAGIIDAKTIADNNYAHAWEILNERFENPRVIVETHISGLLNLKPMVKESHKELRKLIDTCTRHIDGLTFMEQSVDKTAGLIINKILTSCLDLVTRKHWETTLAHGELPDINTTLAFLKDQCRVLERCEADCQTQTSLKLNQTKSSAGKGSNVKIHPVISEPKNSALSCYFCGKGHLSFQCSEFRALLVVDRIAKVKETGVCFNCLCRGHRAANCPSKRNCFKCNKRHHSLLHEERVKSVKVNESIVEVIEDGNCLSKSTSGTNVSSSCAVIPTNRLPNVLLLTAEVYLKDKNNQLVVCRAFLDSGAQTNMISLSMYEKLGLHGTPIDVDVVGINNTRNKSNRLVTIELISLYSDYRASLRCLVTPKITSTIPQTTVDISTWNIPAGLRLADTNFHKPAEVDLLIGIQHFFELFKPGHIILEEGLPELRETHLGWVISGEIADETSFVNIQQVNAATIESVNKLIKQFWELEDINPTSTRTTEEQECEENFCRTYRRDSTGRYIVELPFRDNISMLANNRSLALRRFFTLEKRLMKDVLLRKQYCEFLEEYQKLGHCREIDETYDPPGKLKYYMPHHSVMRPISSTTKLRVVFDASAKASASVASLNDVLQVGASVQSDLMTILLRFRKYCYVFTADIKKMYRQILVDSKHTSLQRIFWRQHPLHKIRVFEMTTVTYGTASAPFLATRSLMQLCKDEGEGFPMAKRVIEEDCYMDDILSGADTLKDVVECRDQIIALLLKGGFPVHKWCANNEAFLDGILESEREKLITIENLAANEVIKTLGLIWNPLTDEFHFSVNQSNLDSNVVTKRYVFSEAAKIFDPLGLISPVTVLAKHIIQKTWIHKIDWDTPLEGDLLLCWMKFQASLSKLNEINIPRLITCSAYVSAELHGFSDASNIAYGACLYLRTVQPGGEISTRLICSKSRIAPLQLTTIPRLELCGALLLSRLVKRVSSALQIEFSSINLWSDSRIVLAWLKKPPAMLQSFVRNRVAEINESSFGVWNYVASKENPADVISRGQSPEVLKYNKLWWDGPVFLRQPHYQPNPLEELSDEEIPEMKSPVTCVLSAINADGLPLFKKFSSFRKLQRVVAYVLRFIANCRSKDKNNRIKTLLPQVLELRKALHVIVKVVQHDVLSEEIHRINRNKPCKSIGMLGPFFDDEVLRVGGRLQKSNLPLFTKHQYILPKHYITDLIIRAYHEENLHVGPKGLLAALRQKFWILRSQSTVRRITRSCVVCFRVKPKNVTQYMGNLPNFRVTPAAPFLYTGVDYAGPIQVKQGTRKPVLVKAYIAVFVCLATKAIHLELVSDMTTAAFGAALHRFVSRRGLPKEIHSDNGSNFRGAKSEMHELFRLFRNEVEMCGVQEFCMSKEIIWHFIPPEAPEFGGLWEAAVKSTKYHLKRVLKETPLTFEEFSTLLSQVEAILNSRPLCAYSDDPGEEEAITPSHFLIGRPLNAVPEPTYEDVKKYNLTRWKHLQLIKTHFWKSWMHDYLVSLQPRGKNKQRLPNLKPGMIVIVEDKNLPPQNWKLGKIVKVYPGEDNLVRAVDVKVGDNVYRRPVTKLSILPIYDNI